MRNRFWRPARLLEFAGSEEAGGFLLIAASIAALAWSNSAWAPRYHSLLTTRLAVHATGLSVQSAVNDGLMSLFFLLAGLEIRQEVTTGHLATPRGLAAPGLAALGGMAVPAAIYLALNHANPASARGWAVPVATDIAFSLAVLRLLGTRIGASVRVFLTAVAILDDLGAIVVIALFYSFTLAWPMLAGAAALCAAMLVLRRAGVAALWPYLAAGAALWLLVFNSGIHATLAGVALAVLLPRQAAARLEPPLAGLVGYAVLPLFGLANAGLDLGHLHPAVLLTPGPLGVILGLCLGKQAGVFGATLLGRRLGVLTLPPAMGTAQLYGAALLCGIGFTMSLFIAHLAFRQTLLHENIKLAVFCASVLSAILGAGVLLVAGAGGPEAKASKQGLLF